MPDSERRRSPFSIAHHLFRALAERYNVKAYHLLDKGKIDYAETDVILGHPWFGDDYVMNRAILENKKARLKAIVLPMERSTLERYPRLPQLFDRVDLIFAITGPYWWKQFQLPPYDRWAAKMVRLDMATDVAHYPFLKNKFNPPGQRGYLYIGRNSPFKGIPTLSETMKRLSPHRVGWVGGGGDIPHVPRVAKERILDEAFGRQLASKFDFFVNASTHDANPTTILEAMAWGYPIACTEQSGYDNLPHQIKLRMDDPQYNAEVLQGLQAVPEPELFRWTRENRRLVEKDFTWDKFCRTVINAVN